MIQISRLRSTAALLLISLLLAACSISPPASPPELGTPPVVVNDDNYITHITKRTINWDRVQFRRWLETNQLVTFFPKDKGIAGVKSTTPMRGTWGQNGAIRRVSLDDGHYAFDLIINNQYPDVFQYQVFGFTNDASRVTEYVRAELKYIEDKAGVTTLQWTYSLRPKSALTRPLLNSFVQNKLIPYMEEGMDNMAKAAADAPKP
jgi:hypothetical protein